MARRRWIGLTATSIAGTLALGGCGGPSDPGGGNAEAGGSSDTAPAASSAQPVTLRMVAADYSPEGGRFGPDGSSGADATEDYWDTVIAEFQRAHPRITVDLQIVPWRDLDAQIQVMVKNNQVPDLLLADRFSALATSGQLYRADDVLSDGVREDLLGPLARAGTVDGQQYGIPFAARPRQLVYNKDLLERAGQRVPKSWSGLAKAAEALREDKVPVPYGMALASGDAADAQGAGQNAATAEAAQWMLGNGSRLADDAGRPALDGVREADALDWVRANLVEPGLAGKPAETGTAELVEDFAAGRVGMMNADPSVLAALAAAKADGDDATPAIDYGVAAVPGRDGALERSLTTSDWMLAFRKNGHQEQVRTFLDFVYQPERQAEFAAAHGLLPVTGEGREAASGEGGHPGLAPWLKTMSGSGTVTYPTGSPAWAGAAGALATGVGPAVSGAETGPTALVESVREAVADAEGDS